MTCGGCMPHNSVRGVTVLVVSKPSLYPLKEKLLWIIKEFKLKILGKILYSVTHIYKVIRITIWWILIVIGMQNANLSSRAQWVRRKRSTNNAEPNVRGRQEIRETSRPVTVEDMVRTMRGIAQQRAPTNKFVEFKKLAPPYFDGKSGPLEAEKWIYELEKFFDVLNCDELERVRFAVFQLQGNANNWWKMEKLTFGENISTLS